MAMSVRGGPKMKTLPKLAACVALLAAAAACGQDRGADDLSGEEREKLNALAESQDINGADVVDTSPDSLVTNDEWGAAETGEAAPVEASNGAVANVQ
jgi:hypothetical protein